MAALRGRDPRVDVLRGLCLLMVFVDHIPGNTLSALTLQSFGFSDAAEMFVLLAGFSATLAYSGSFERQGTAAGLRKVAARVATIYGAQAVLLLVSLMLVRLSGLLFGMEPTHLAPIIREGSIGVLRGLTLTWLPAYLDILPLYMLLLLAFPVVRLGLRWSIAGTLILSTVCYAVSNLLHYNLPNSIDPRGLAGWQFNPFAWQLIYVAGAAMAEARRRDLPIMASPPRWLTLAGAIVLIAAFVMTDGWGLWPGVAQLDYRLLGNEPKCFLTPWRFVHALSLGYLLLAGVRMLALARSAAAAPLATCGRHALPVFCAVCVLSLLGRIAFRLLGHGAPVQVAVNAIGLLALLSFAGLLQDFKERGMRPGPRPHMPLVAQGEV